MTHQKRCHDCDCAEGEYHILGCDMERCPFCRNQLITCDCRYRLLGFDPVTLQRDRPGIYAWGLNPNQEGHFERLLEERGRIRYIAWPVLCRYCGQAWPEFFNVPDQEWQAIVPVDHSEDVLCRPCYDHIKACMEAGGKSC